MPVLEPAAPVTVRRREWPALPPIQRSIEPMRPVSPQADFSDSLLSWRNPSFLAPLGHVVSADAPSGVIHQLIEPAGPPPTSSSGPSLEFVAPPSLSPARGGVVQRMIAAVSPWASRGSSPAAPLPDDGPRAEPLAATPPPAQPADIPAVPPVRRPDPTPSVQRSAAGTTPMTRAPIVVMPDLELPVIAAPASTAETVTGFGAEPEPVAADADSFVPPEAASPDAGAAGPAPTLGVGVPSPAGQPGDGRADGSADVSSLERRALAPAVETLGRPPRIDPVAQRMIELDPAPSAPGAAPASPDAPGIAGGPSTLGAGGSPFTIQRADGGAGGPSEISAQPGEGRASAEETSPGAAQLAPVVQRRSDPAPPPALDQEPTPTAASASSAAPSTSEGGEEMSAAPALSAVPTLGAQPSSFILQRVDDPASVDVPMPQSTGNPAVAQSPATHPRIDPMIQRSQDPAPHAAPGRAGGSRRLGLGPPLSPDAVTAQRSPVQHSPAPPAATPPPLVVAPSSPPTSPSPAETSGVAAAPGAASGSDSVQETDDVTWVGAGEESDQSGVVEYPAAIQPPQPGSPQSVSEEIVPLLGQPASASVQRDVTAGSEPEGLTVQDVSLPLVPRAAEAGTPPRELGQPELGQLMAPVVGARPVVARLVGDRPAPLFTTASGPHGP
ncbi:MAG: hypothetical protein LC799_22550, partial [Actinobacteria bacterium]|nr:hypothetical protein [Actinomycetota bacterium]